MTTPPAQIGAGLPLTDHLGPAVQAIQGSMLTGFPPVQPLLVLAGYAVVFGFLAKRFFRWD
jgi:hypothetical protein